MPDLSQVPLGAGVSIYSGLRTSLGYLYDPNQAVYQVSSSSSEWYLLFIRASKSAVGQPWSFSLQSMPVEDVANIFTQGSPGYDPPRIVDSVGDPINTVVGPDLTMVDEEFPEESFSAVIKEGSHTGNSTLTIKTKTVLRRHHLEEIGTYIMPIAYHTITASGMDIRQVARSDWAFWPMPAHEVWSRDTFVSSFTNSGSTNLPGSTIPESFVPE